MGAKLSGKIAAVPKVLRNGKELSKSPMVILPRSKEALKTYDCKRKPCTALLLNISSKNS
jgi:hypothetical protein